VSARRRLIFGLDGVFFVFFIFSSGGNLMKIVAKNNFADQRLKHGLSMELLSEKADVALLTVFLAEHRSPIYPKTAGKLCAALNCNFDDIFEIRKDL
jgi:DNA-binding Xre family transcriptional regulator